MQDESQVAFRHVHWGGEQVESHRDHIVQGETIGAERQTDVVSSRCRVDDAIGHVGFSRGDEIFIVRVDFQTGVNIRGWHIHSYGHHGSQVVEGDLCISLLVGIDHGVHVVHCPQMGCTFVHGLYLPREVHRCGTDAGSLIEGVESVIGR